MEDQHACLRKYHLFSTKSRLFLVGRSKDRQQWRILKFNRDPAVPTELDVVEDPVTYTEQECAALLAQIGAGNLAHGGIKYEVTVRLCALLGLRQQFRAAPRPLTLNG
jgi:hypothetical protein